MPLTPSMSDMIRTRIGTPFCYIAGDYSALLGAGSRRSLPRRLLWALGHTAKFDAKIAFSRRYHQCQQKTGIQDDRSNRFTLVLCNDRTRSLNILSGLTVEADKNLA